MTNLDNDIKENSSSTMKRIAVIGSGASGLAAAKACKEEGLEFVCYEKSGRIAGLWNYHDDDLDGESSVMKTTVINSSKEMSAFSDFPPPKEFPNYMHNRKMLKYLTMYADKFGVTENIKYYHEVLKIVQTPDYDETGRWNVSVKNLKEDSVIEETFDGVMICTGHHGFPYSPKFKGQEDFKGKVLHTHSLKVPDAFKDKRVLIVGVGNSGLDAAVDISNVAKQVYLSTRRGTWITFRLDNNGLPIDLWLLTRTFVLLRSIFGEATANSFVERSLNDRFDHATYNIKPKHRFFGQHLAINDHLPNKILSGTVIMKADIKCFTEKGAIFEGEESVTKVDAIVLATGYKIKYPFLSETILDTTNNRAELYKYVFPPHLKHPSLAIIGLIQPFGSLFPIFEAQSRWYARLMNQKVKLPKQEVMMQDIKGKSEVLAKRYVGTQRHTVQVDFIEFMDEIYNEIGAKPNLLKLAITDPFLFYHCYFGPCTSYQYRLQGPHAWKGARKAILECRDRILCPLNSRPKISQNELTQNFYFILSLYILLAVVFFLLAMYVLHLFK